mmetsp:Transcript_1108/g.3280  ORF Transcript_1108/g.3280 Transcript_1108/m.3280 type:complete len:404 (-) Transcript_1108:221-1432(-)
MRRHGPGERARLFPQRLAPKGSRSDEGGFVFGGGEGVVLGGVFDLVGVVSVLEFEGQWEGVVLEMHLLGAAASSAAEDAEGEKDEDGEERKQPGDERDAFRRGGGGAFARAVGAQRAALEEEVDEDKFRLGSVRIVLVVAGVVVAHEEERRGPGEQTEGLEVAALLVLPRFPLDRWIKGVVAPFKDLIFVCQVFVVVDDELDLEEDNGRMLGMLRVVPFEDENGRVEAGELDDSVGAVQSFDDCRLVHELVRRTAAGLDVPGEHVVCPWRIARQFVLRRRQHVLLLVVGHGVGRREGFETLVVGHASAHGSRNLVLRRGARCLSRRHVHLEDAQFRRRSFVLLVFLAAHVQFSVLCHSSAFGVDRLHVWVTQRHTAPHIHRHIRLSHCERGLEQLAVVRHEDQ